MARVTLRSLTKRYPGGVTAVDALDLEIADGEFFALLGPSGCGKTTLLRTIAGLEAATTGQVIIDDVDVTRLPPGDRDIGMVFQDYALYPHMTVQDNIAYPLKVRKVNKDERRGMAADAAGNLQLGELLERRPGQLSGGQQQRVAVARAIAYQPRLFLFDEPLSNLDAQLRVEARTFLKRLQAEIGVTTVYVTHDQSEALALADRMAVMQRGRVRQLATPEEVYRRPNSLFVASFIGSMPMNLLDAEVVDGALDVAGSRLSLPPDSPEHVTSGDRVVFGSRPEFATLHDEPVDNALEGQVAVAELLGNSYLLTVEGSGLQMRAVAAEAAPNGTRVWVTFDEANCLLYRRDDGGLVGSPRVEGDEAVDADAPRVAAGRQ
ncbi:sn-glycerol-3-phosphate ABC transporter ATP-binding protein UgpC [soil metagenome]